MFCPRCHRMYPLDHRFCPVDGEATTDEPSVDQIGFGETSRQGALFGRRYEIMGSIGKGAMAQVYLAKDRENGTLVAIKVMRKLQRRDDDLRTRFLREARAVTKIRHPNIVKMIEAGINTEDTTPYLVMEFLFGEPVGSYLLRDGKLPLHITANALQQAASALAAAHDQGVIHRDLKPDNLFFVGPVGDPRELKVLDFGFSRLQKSQLTAAGMVLGTPAFMAPEQILSEEVDARTDIYGLGLVMYRMLTGKPAFTANDDVTLLAQQLFNPPTQPSKLVPDLDPRAEAVVMTAIQKDPGNRYASMKALEDDLAALTVAGAPIKGAPKSGDRYQPTSAVGGPVAESLRRHLGSSAGD